MVVVVVIVAVPVVPVVFVVVTPDVVVMVVCPPPPLVAKYTPAPTAITRMTMTAIAAVFDIALDFFENIGANCPFIFI